MLNTYAVDFESTYANGRDISSLGVVPYLEHPDTDIYLVAIVGPGVSYSGPLESAPWRLIDGQHWISHNAAFDGAAHMEACRRGKVPALPDGSFPLPTEWDCTANLAVFLGAPRSLAKACAALLGINVDKAVRDQMKGKQWGTMSPEFQGACASYALLDSENCLKLWEKFHAKWTDREVALSRHTMVMTLRGIGVDRARVESGIATLATALWECEERIPWAGDVNGRGKETPILSANALKAECAKRGIPAPLTTADKSPIFEKWMNKYEGQADFVRAVKDYRSINRTLEVLKKLRDQVRSDGRLRYSLKYFGAHTGRWSGDAGLNFQNLTKRPVKGVDVRGCLVPGPGKKFIVADLSQIEARVALWFAGDDAQLDLVRAGLDLYEAHARSQMGYNGDLPLAEYCELPGLPESERNKRQFAKCRVLGLGFGLGSIKFVDIVAQWARIVISKDQAWEIVSDFRARNQGIVRLWAMLGAAMTRHVNAKQKEPFSIELPSGRRLEYFNVNGSSDLRAQQEINGPMLYWYGGKLFENLVQATARDLFGDAILRIEGAGHPVVLHGHDEVVCEVDLDVDPTVIRALMTEVPDWAEGLPVGCTAKSTDRYFK